MVARLSRYHFALEQLSAVMKAHWSAVEADPFIYERGLLAAFVFSDRDSGETVGLTVADAPEALRCTHTEPAGAVADEVHD